MRKIIYLAAVLSVGSLAGGCIPVVAGGLIYDNIADRDARAKFQSDLAARNLEREKAGLKPLDWCSETYKAKKSWAEADTGCAARVKQYEAGDRTALQM